MQLISNEYRELNSQFHRENRHYGTCGVQYLDEIISLIRQLKSQDVLDYGCGKGTLSQNLPFKINQYDPAIEKYSARPKPADLVVCTDVLEHIEPELLDNVLRDIHVLTKRHAYLVAATVPAQKKLPDGRNTHLIVKDYRWWISKILEHFEIGNVLRTENRIVFVVEPQKKIQGTTQCSDAS